MTRIVIADDQALFREGLRTLLSTRPDMDVVGEAADGDEAVALVEQLRPSVVLMDLRMPKVDGIQATARLRERCPEIPVLVLTTFDDDEALWGALDAGAAGFVLKDASADDLIAAARSVARGGAWLDPKVAPRVLAAFRADMRPRLDAAARVDQLTDREHDVLRHMARGATNGEIAASLYVSEATVKTHVGAIFAKLGARDRAAAIVFAYDHGIVGIPPGAEPT